MPFDTVEPNTFDCQQKKLFWFAILSLFCIEKTEFFFFEKRNVTLILAYRNKHENSRM